MNITFLVRGLIIGISVAAVVGPIAILCMQRTMNNGFLYGLVTGLGAATADAMYGSIAAFGLTVITAMLVHLQGWIHLLGGLFLIYLGMRTLFRRPAEKAAKTSEGSHARIYLSTLMLTLTNPQTILSFAAIFAGLGIGMSGGDPNNGKSVADINSILVVGGVFLGSALWWLLLSGGISIVRGRFSARWLLWVNRLAGFIILLCGFYALLGNLA